MALWGSKDLVGNAGTIVINLSTKVVTGSATTFTTSGHVVSEGDILVVGSSSTFGHAVISSVTSNTLISIASTQHLIPNPTTNIISGASYFVTQRPISSIQSSTYAAPEVRISGFSTIPLTRSVFGVDTTEASVARTTTYGGKAGAFSVAHSGWVGVTTYVDCHGNLRVKSETLVAGSMISQDANDDNIYPDS